MGEVYHTLIQLYLDLENAGEPTQHESTKVIHCPRGTTKTYYIPILLHSTTCNLTIHYIHTVLAYDSAPHPPASHLALPSTQISLFSPLALLAIRSHIPTPRS
jgi:hypothetical protein